METVTACPRVALAVSQQLSRRNTLSETNGDKARFARERKKKTLQRQRNRELRKALGAPKQTSTSARSTSRAG